MACKDNKKCSKIGNTMFMALLIASIMSISVSVYTWNLLDNTIVETGKIVDTADKQIRENYVQGLRKQYVRQDAE